MKREPRVDVTYTNVWSGDGECVRVMNLRLTVNGREHVVIDPESDSRLADALNNSLPATWWPESRKIIRDSLATALRSLAEPPRPPEPTGLGAVVEDAEGADWHRTRDGRWIAEDGLRSRAGGWDHISAVRVLSEGVTP